jgi:bifunctional DNA-binding transcriptional regulator/antitoxin component of YhaV-PrlF toxin-antitoxin module
MAKRCELRFLDKKHRITVPAEFAKPLNWNAAESLCAEIRDDGSVKLVGAEAGAQKIAALRAQLLGDEDPEDVEAAIADRFREVNFYPPEWRVTLPIELHILFEPALARVGLLVEKRNDGVVLLSQAQRLARRKDWD